jgi:hypothetical protein
MKIGFVSDLHVGNFRRFGGEMVNGLNERAHGIAKVLGAAIARAREADCAAFVINGDVFDGTRPEPQVIALVQDVLAKAAPMKVIALVGNHDQVSGGEGDHALGPLAPVAQIVDKPTTIRIGGPLHSSRVEDPVDLVCVPFCSGAAKLWLGGVLEANVPHVQAGKRKPKRLLSVHLGVSDDATPPWLRDAHDSIHVDLLTELATHNDIDAVFTGNWHDHVFWDGAPAICQVGALVPTGWDNPGVDGYGGIAIYDSTNDAIEMVHLPGARFVNARDAVHLRKLAVAAHAAGHHVYARITSTPADVRGNVDQIAALRDERLISGGEVVLDNEEAQRAAKDAAATARSANTLEEALTGFVGEMPLEDGVDRPTVLALSKAYLAGAQ